MTEENELTTHSYTIYICKSCMKLEGEMCNTPGCVFIRCDMLEVEGLLNRLNLRPKVNEKVLYIGECSCCNRQLQANEWGMNDKKSGVNLLGLFIIIALNEKG